MKPLLFCLIISTVLCGISYTDKCFRYDKVISNTSSRYLIILWIDTDHYQYFLDRDGTPLGYDVIVDKSSSDTKIEAVSYYYQYNHFKWITNSNVYSNCVKVVKGYKCIETCESVWFKIYNATAALEYVHDCDKVFYEKYGDIT